MIIAIQGYYDGSASEAHQTGWCYPRGLPSRRFILAVEWSRGFRIRTKRQDSKGSSGESTMARMLPVCQAGGPRLVPMPYMYIRVRVQV